MASASHAPCAPSATDVSVGGSVRSGSSILSLGVVTSAGLRVYATGATVAIGSFFIVVALLRVVARTVTSVVDTNTIPTLVSPNSVASSVVRLISVVGVFGTVVTSSVARPLPAGFLQWSME
ncbi:hypothetical protein FKM82_021356 [Ascaphus truei]